MNIKEMRKQTVEEASCAMLRDVTEILLDARDEKIPEDEYINAVIVRIHEYLTAAVPATELTAPFLAAALGLFQRAISRTFDDVARKLYESLNEANRNADIATIMMSGGKLYGEEGDGDDE